MMLSLLSLFLAFSLGLDSASDTLAAIQSESTPETKVETRHVQIEIIARTFDGAPLIRIPISCREPLPSIVLRTDDKGYATLEASLPVRAMDVSVSSNFRGEMAEPLSRTEEFEMSTNILRLQSEYYFEPVYSTRISAEATKAVISVIAYDGVQVSGMLRDSDGRHVGALVHCPPAALPGVSSDGRPFRTPPIMRGRKATLYVRPLSIRRVLPLSITAKQMEQDVDLGEIVVPGYVEEASIGISTAGLLDASLKLGRKYLLHPGVTLVKTDGSLILTLPFEKVRDNAATQLAVKNNQPVKIPIGAYYLVPDLFRNKISQHAVVVAAREGIDISDAKLPILGAVEDKHTEVSLDVIEAQTAADKVVKILREKGVDLH